MQGIITPVTKPKEWCTLIFVITKKDTDNMRMCVEHSLFNKYIKKEIHQSEAPAQAVTDNNANSVKIFTKLDQSI